jgi:hypothetical protein
VTCPSRVVKWFVHLADFQSLSREVLFRLLSKWGIEIIWCRGHWEYGHNTGFKFSFNQSVLKVRRENGDEGLHRAGMIISLHRILLFQKKSLKTAKEKQDLEFQSQRIISGRPVGAADRC